MNDAKSNTSSLSPGTMLRARYRIDKVLGQGGFGITYAAFDTKNFQKVAVKELFPSRFVSRSGNHHTVIVNSDEADTFQQMLASFEKEANVLIQLQHLEGVADPWCYGVEPGHFVLCDGSRERDLSAGCFEANSVLCSGVYRSVSHALCTLYALV